MEGVFSLLFKKGDPELFSNWRPLTLLGVDYKIIARALAVRLGKAMPHVVHSDQTCRVEGRSVLHNLQLVRDSISWVQDRGLPLVLVSLDQDKAFDRVSHWFLFRVLEQLGFGPNFRRWIGILYAGVGSRVKINGFLGDFVFQTRGVRQGSPLSALLYVLYLQPLAAAVRTDSRVKGLWLPGGGGEEVRMAVYADGLTLFLTSDRSIEAAMQVVGNFGKASGLAINIGKCKIKYFGTWVGKRHSVSGMEVCTGPLRVLGVDFVEGDSSFLNWDRRIVAVRQKLGLWQQRPLSLTGKTLVLKADVMSSLLFLSVVFPLPARLRNGLTRVVFRFVWGSYEYVQRARMY